VFDRPPFHSPAAFYRESLLLYSYGESPLTRRRRFGYLVAAPTMPDRVPRR
jgi:hypothetical protein